MAVRLVDRAFQHIMLLLPHYMLFFQFLPKKDTNMRSEQCSFKRVQLTLYVPSSVGEETEKSRDLSLKAWLWYVSVLIFFKNLLSFQFSYLWKVL